MNTGSFTVTGQDTRFNGANVSGDTIDLGYTDGFCDRRRSDLRRRELERQHRQRNPIGGLTPGNVYFVIVVDRRHVKLADSKANAMAGTPIHLTAGQRRVAPSRPDRRGHEPRRQLAALRPVDRRQRQHDHLPYTFSVSPAIRSSTAQAAARRSAASRDGATYYAISLGGNTYELADSKCHATGLAADCGGSPGVVTPITLDKTQATGRSHSVVEQGNTPSSDASQEGPQTVTTGTVAGFKGVGVSATNSDTLAAVGVSAAVGGSAGVGVSGTVNVITVNTNATIGKHAVVNDNAGAAAGPNVLVAAGNQYHEILAAASVAVGGGAGVGASVDVAILHLNANALIDDSATVRATNDITISATQTDTVDSITIAGGGGTVGVSAAVNVLVITNHVYAETGSNATLAAGNNAALLASDTT